MDRSVLMGLVVLAFLGLILLMVIGWRARKRKHAGLPAPDGVPGQDELGELLGRFAGQYVATTTAGDPLDRVVTHGLAFRAHAGVMVWTAGLVVRIPGEDDLFIPAVSLRELRTATWTIDRVVEDGGLQLIGWTLGGTDVDSYFRMQQPGLFAQAIEQLLSTRTERQSW